MLSIVSDPAGDVVHIHGDLAGLEVLERAVAQLKEIVAAGGCQDSHLFSASWGGSELTETMLEQEHSAGWTQVNHIKLFGWTQDWSARHGLSSDAP